MKRYSFIFFLASFLGVTSFTACEEEATLDGATEVYITIDPMDINLKLGDTVRISATVTNVSGKVIETPVSWSIEDQTVAACWVIPLWWLWMAVRKKRPGSKPCWRTANMPLLPLPCRAICPTV